MRLVVMLVALAMVCSNVHGSIASEAVLTPPYGPLRLVNQQPTQLLFLQPFPAEAEVLSPGRLGVHFNTALTNTLVHKANKEVEATLDLEMVRTVFDVRYGVRRDLEVGLEIPFLYTYGGILDDFIINFERFVSKPRNIRRGQVTGRVDYRVARHPHVLIAGQDNALGVGDVVLKAKALVLYEQAWLPAVGLRAAVKFPSGEASRAFGSGAIDGGFGLLLQKTWGRWTLYLNGDVTFPGQAFEDVDISLQPFFGGVFAIEYRLSHPVSLVLQLRGDTRPFHDTVSALDKRLVETILGANWALSRRLVLQVGVAEDQFNSACCAADVSFFVNLTGRW